MNRKSIAMAQSTYAAVLRVIGHSPRVILTRGRSCVVRTVVPDGTFPHF